MRCISKPWTKQRNGWTTGYPLSKLLIMKRLTHHQETIPKYSVYGLFTYIWLNNYGLWYIMYRYGIYTPYIERFGIGFFIRPSPRRIQ